MDGEVLVVGLRPHGKTNAPRLCPSIESAFGRCSKEGDPSPVKRARETLVLPEPKSKAEKKFFDKCRAAVF